MTKIAIRPGRWSAKRHDSIEKEIDRRHRQRHFLDVVWHVQNMIQVCEAIN